MLTSILPASFIALAIRPGKRSCAMLLITHITALIATTIWPCEDSASMHLVVFPSANITASINPLVRARSFDVVLVEVSVVVGSIFPDKLALSGFHSIPHAALKHGAIRPLLDAMSMLTVLEPFTVIARTVLMNKKPLAMDHIIFPMPHIISPICVDMPPKAVRHSILPVPFKDAPIFKPHFPLSMPQARFGPLTDINRSIVQQLRLPHLNFNTIRQLGVLKHPQLLHNKPD
jgi:hypothetical protein